MKSYIEHHPRREEWFQRDFGVGGRDDIFHIWINTEAEFPGVETILDLGMEEED